jgi:hypothetical protein
MIPRVMHAECLGGYKKYKIRLRFADGAEGDVDLSSGLYGEVADIAPEFLYDNRRG